MSCHFNVMLSSVNPNTFRFVPNRIFFLFWYQDSLKMELDLQLMFLRRRLPWLSADSHVNWFSFGKFWLERKPKRVFRLLTSDFQLQTSEFRLPTSGFRLQTSDFRLQTYDCRSIHHAGINAQSPSSVERTTVPFSPQKRTTKLALEKATKHKANPATDEVRLENRNHGLAWSHSGNNKTVQTLLILF